MFLSERPLTGWPRVAQIFVGLFFVGIGYYKLKFSFFGMHAVALDQVFQSWMHEGWPLWGYRQFLEWSLPHAGWLGGVITTCQILAGIMLVYGVRVRVAALILLFVQLNIFLATFHSRYFNVLVGLSLWLGVFTLFQPSQRLWRWLIGAFVLIAGLHLYLRYADFGDAWLSAVSWQRADFAKNVMGISPALKHVVLVFTASAPGRLAWAGVWWLELAATLGMLTRVRLQSVALLLIIFIIRTLLWTNSYGPESVLWVLTLFTVLTYDEQLLRTILPDFQRSIQGIPRSQSQNPNEDHIPESKASYSRG